jgi:hypothetical protein
MHLQIRTKPALSPPDLAAFLTVLAENEVNMLSAGGCDIEAGGEFIFSVEHDTERDVMAILERAGYEPQLVEVEVCAVADEPGQLLECITAIREQNVLAGRVIRDITVGVPDADGRLQVQVYSDVADS